MSLEHTVPLPSGLPNQQTDSVEQQNLKGFLKCTIALFRINCLGLS